MKIDMIRETRDSIPSQSRMYAARVGAGISIADGEHASYLEGPLADWVMAHMVVTGELEGPEAIADHTLTITADTGEVITFLTRDGSANQPEVPPAPPPAAEALPPPVTVPTPDIPGPPDSAEDWGAMITAAQDREIGVLENVAADEAAADYSTRVLAPLGLTIAEAARQKTALTAALAGASPLHPSWQPILAAAGITLDSTPAL